MRRVLFAEVHLVFSGVFCEAGVKKLLTAFSAGEISVMQVPYRGDRIFTCGR